MPKKTRTVKFVEWDNDPYVDVYPIEIRSIDAWRDQDGWSHNNSFVICREECKRILISADITNRKVYKLLRDLDVLSHSSKGKLRIEERFPYLEIQLKGTFQPLVQIQFLEDEKKELYVG